MFTGDFKAGVQYAFEIYGCSAEGHRRHEKQIGYLQEQSKSAHTLHMQQNRCQSTLVLIEVIFQLSYLYKNSTSFCYTANGYLLSYYFNILS